jgi:hypothetical protein
MDIRHTEGENRIAVVTIFIDLSDFSDPICGKMLRFYN